LSIGIRGRLYGRRRRDIYFWYGWVGKNYWCSAQND
jgi:hypothetical protein